ncbi:DNA methyltransferase [uncultured Mobiluncus sp.]|uniref:DNA methyltransferase n=1 Tax=uncultured Mobiluncus sp. TaxID=293425 RepID=UPI00262F8D66|nr:DNA methyltransferase [uncultured Mobiluncus sp.]
MNPTELAEEPKAKSVVEEAPKVDPRNKLNDLTGSEWMPLTKSFTYQKGLGTKHPHAQIERQHPAPFSFQDISQLISFFTKKGMTVLDPFGGVGSTAKAAAVIGRKAISIELQKQWHDLAIERLEVEVAAGAASEHRFINQDSREALWDLEPECVDFVVTSPPYWSILNKRADHKVKKERLANDLATNYSDSDPKDLANVSDYAEFLDVLVSDFVLPSARALRTGKYLCMVVSDFRHKSEFVSFHSDLIQRLNGVEVPDGGRITLQGVKVLLQNHKSLLPYGYPFAYVENIHHQYILIFRKVTKVTGGVPKNRNYKPPKSR